MTTVIIYDSRIITASTRSDVRGRTIFLVVDEVLEGWGYVMLYSHQTGRCIVEHEDEIDITWLRLDEERVASHNIVPTLQAALVGTRL